MGDMVRFWLLNISPPDKANGFAHEMNLGNVKGLIDDARLLA